MRRLRRKWIVGAFLVATVLVVGATSASGSLRTPSAHRPTRHSHTLTVNITPNGQVPAHWTCHWNASVSGGSGNYSYAWRANNSPVGFDSPVLTYTNNGSPFRIDVTVTDNSTSDQGADSNIMSIGGTFCN
jgi:hypothetical protein